MTKNIKRSQLFNIIKEEMMRMNESGFDNYDMQPQAPVTNQQQLAQQRQNGEIESYLDSNLNTDNFNGQLGMDAQSADQDVADTEQLTIGTPRQTANNFDACSRQKYGYAESKDGKITMKESQFRKLVKECFMEVMKERK